MKISAKLHYGTEKYENVFVVGFTGEGKAIIVREGESCTSYAIQGEFDIVSLSDLVCTDNNYVILNAHKTMAKVAY